MSFRYTRIGELMNEDKFADAAQALVKELADEQFAAAERTKKPVEVGTNSSAVARKLKVNYRTVTRWIAVLLDRGHDVKTQAKTEVERRLKDQKRAA